MYDFVFAVRRIYCCESRVLWDRAKQRADHLSSVPDAMSKSRAVRVLGRVPPNRESEHHYGEEGF
jgi:hypothetical protein